MVKLNALGVVADDVATSVAFYRRVGVPFPADLELDNHVECALGDGMRLMIDAREIAAGLDPGFTGAPGDRVGFAAELDRPADVDALYAELAAEGHGHTPPYDAPWGMRYATLRDPVGVKVDLYARM